MKRAAARILVGLVVSLAAVGCGDDPAGPSGPSGDDAPPEAGQVDDGATADVPEECRDPFPQAWEPADLAEVTLMPDGFPDPPVEATLCLTAETVGGAQETASYATSATAEEILTGYETALASYGATRDTDGVGRPIVTASDGDLVVQVTPQDGGFVLAFAD